MFRNLLLITLLITSSVAKSQTDTGNLDTYLQQAIDDMPGRGGQDFQLPSSQALEQWERAMNQLLSGRIGEARSTADSFSYNVIRYTDTTLQPHQTFLMLKAQTPVQNHWGIYVFNPDPCRKKLVIQSPHPKYDLNTGDQGVYCFKRLSAKALFLSGTHRCNQDDTAACSGTTSVCTGSKAPYPTSDMAHNVETPFQRATSLLNTWEPELVFVQLHGFGQDPDDPFVIMSNGTRETPDNDYLADLETELKQIDTALTFKIAHKDTAWDRLIGFTNVQGRLINGSNTPCTQDAFSSDGRFLHIEQEKSRLREDSNRWYKMYQALSNVFECDQTSTRPKIKRAASSVTIYPNPTSGKIYLRNEQVQAIKVFDNHGQMVKSLDSKFNGKPSFHLNDLPAGLYFLQISLPNSLAMGKLMKIR